MSIDRDVGRTLGEARRVVLAVSGGRDSMVLLESAARVARDAVVAVATFDHGSGAAATAAADAVVERALALGLAARRGVAREPARNEAAWRAARWSFLLSVAAEAAA